MDLWSTGIYTGTSTGTSTGSVPSLAEKRTLSDAELASPNDLPQRPARRQRSAVAADVAEAAARQRDAGAPGGDGRGHGGRGSRPLYRASCYE